MSSDEAIVTCAHFCEGIGDKIGFWKVIRVAKNVGKRERVDGKQPRRIQEATVGKGVAVLLRPGVQDVVIFLVGQLGQVPYK